MTGGRDGDWVWESMDDLLLCVENPRSAVDAAHRYLAAEVRRQADVIELLQRRMSEQCMYSAGLKQGGAGLLATLARVASLGTKWRERSTEEHDEVARNVERELADELEAALRGDE